MPEPQADGAEHDAALDTTAHSEWEQETSGPESGASMTEATDASPTSFGTGVLEIIEALEDRASPETMPVDDVSPENVDVLTESAADAAPLAVAEEAASTAPGALGIGGGEPVLEATGSETPEVALPDGEALQVEEAAADAADVETPAIGTPEVETPAVETPEAPEVELTAPEAPQAETADASGTEGLPAEVASAEAATVEMAVAGVPPLEAETATSAASELAAAQPAVVQPAVVQPSAEVVPAAEEARASVPWWPFVAYLGLWVAGLGAAAYLLLQLPYNVALYEQQVYAFVVLGGLVLTALGVLMIPLVWLLARSDAPREARGGLFARTAMYGALSTLLGVVLWWAMLIALDFVRLGRPL